MATRVGTTADIETLQKIYVSGRPQLEASAAVEELARLLDDPSQGRVLFSDAPGGQVEALLVAGPDPEGFDGWALRMLSTSPTSFGRRAGAVLLAAAKPHLLASRVDHLWIRAEPSALPFFLKAGATELGVAPATRRGAPARLLLRLRVNSHPDELESERLLLRAWRASDLPAFARLNADEAVHRFLPGPLSPEVSDALAEQIGAGLSNDGFGYWAVEKRGAASGSEEQFIGFVGVRPVTDLPSVRLRLGHPAVELGWRLLPQFWGQGFATEAAQAAVDYAFSRLHVPEVVAFTVPGNAPSLRVMGRLGLRQDLAGDFEHPSLPEGHPLRPHQLFRRRAPGG